MYFPSVDWRRRWLSSTTGCISSLLAIGVLLSEHACAAVQDKSLADDDGFVLAAVVEHTIIPAHRRANSDTGQPLAIVDETSPLCIALLPGESRCRIPVGWSKFIEPSRNRDGLPFQAGLVPNERVRWELVNSLESRNTESHPLPLPALAGVLLLDARKDQPTDPLDRHYRRRMFAASLSLPGYSQGRHALVYGSYSCGGLCGYSWLFVLEKTGEQWRVTSSTVTAIS